MIFDQLAHLQQYGQLPGAIPAAIEYLLKTDFAQVANGRQELDGDRLYAIVQRYETHPAAEARWEAHRRHIDVQYIVSGAERMGHLLCQGTRAVNEPYDAARDVIFFAGPGSLFVMGQGDVAIFWPQDIHAPGLSVDGNAGDVCKVVVKCRID